MPRILPTPPVARGEQSIYFAFEELPHQIQRNMRSIGIDLGRWVERGLLHFAAFRPSTFGLEVHSRTMLKRIDEIKPQVAIAKTNRTSRLHRTYCLENAFLKRASAYFASQNL